MVYRQQGNYLVERVDDELHIAAKNQNLFFDQLRGEAAPADTRGVPVGTYVKLLDRNGSVLGEIRTIGLVPALPSARIAAATGKPFSVPDPHYRVLVQPVQINRVV